MLIKIKKSLLLILACLLALGFLTSTGAAVQRDDIPQIMRLEYLGKELSQDANNPTVLPQHNNIKIIGNKACVSKDLSFQYYIEGYWTRGGSVMEFDSKGVFMDHLSCPINPHAGFPVEIAYNKTLAIKYVYQEYEYNATIGAEKVEVLSESPVYYVKFLHELDGIDDFRVGWVYKYIILTENQLISELLPGYHFTKSQIIIKDELTDEEHVIDVSENNPNLIGIYSNKIIYTGFSFQRDRYYYIMFPEGAALSDQTFGEDAKHKYSIGHSGSITISFSEVYVDNFLDVDENNWAYPYVIF